MVKHEQLYKFFGTRTHTCPHYKDLKWLLLLLLCFLCVRKNDYDDDAVGVEIMMMMMMRSIVRRKTLSKCHCTHVTNPLQTTGDRPTLLEWHPCHSQPAPGINMDQYRSPC